MLTTSETLARVLSFLPRAHPLRALAVRLAGDQGDTDFVIRREGGIGVLGGPGDSAGPGSALLLWIGADENRQLMLKLPPGRYKVEYWGRGRRSPAGVEIATAPALVLGPPPANAPIAIVRIIDSDVSRRF